MTHDPGGDCGREKDGDNPDIHSPCNCGNPLHGDGARGRL